MYKGVGAMAEVSTIVQAVLSERDKINTELKT